MSILKMEAVTIAGRIEEFDRVVSQYVIGREIHLENAFSVLGKNKRLFPYSEDNQYAVIEKSLKDILDFAEVKAKPEVSADKDVSKETMLSVISEIESKIEEGKKNVEAYQKQIEENKLSMKQLEMLLDINVDISKLFKFEFLNFRFGRMPKGSYKTLNTYLGELDAIFVKISEDESDIWGFYFMPTDFTEKVDAVFASLYFERVLLPGKIIGTPKQSYDALAKENNELTEEIEKEKKAVRGIVDGKLELLSDSYNIAKRNAGFEEIRKKAAHTREFFYVTGWMSQKDAKALEKETEDDESVILVLEDPEKITNIQTPTKLHNIRMFRPFEFFVKMYGLPAYGELDPTPILAITYILLFGIMFGDVGQSAVFAIGGFILYRLKKIDLAAIISMVGVSGTVFGFIYGSVFGNETLLENVALIKPLEKINFMLMSAIVLGVGIILFCMVINMINAIRSKNWGKLLFSPNGLSGMLFYGVLLAAVAVTALIGGAKVCVPVIVALLVLSFLAMYLQEPLSKLVAKKKNWKPEGGIFFVESFFEMFDVLLSFMSNTISFVRVGAFAIIHVGMMMVVGVLAKSAGGGSIIVTILGNILVMGLEGLIVGIQVLRLEYYEMFSRYFEGGGKEFVKLSVK